MGLYTEEEELSKEDDCTRRSETEREQMEGYRELARGINRTVSRSLPDITNLAGSLVSLPKIELPLIDAFSVPSVHLLNMTIADSVKLSSTTSTLTSIAEITKMHSNTINNILKPLTDKWLSQFSEISKSMQEFVYNSYPPNWREKSRILLPPNLEGLLLDEGLPLAWVPPNNVLAKLLAAKDANERRRVLYSNRVGIVSHCLNELKTIDDQGASEYASFAIESAESIRAGHWRSSQALSTNLIESVMSLSFDSKAKAMLTSQKQRLDWESYQLRKALVFGGIWGSYAEYRPYENIPRRYTRHASTHAVSNRQYTNINSLIALMHATALLKLLSENPR